MESAEYEGLEYAPGAEERIEYSKRFEECLKAAGLVVVREDPVSVSSEGEGLSMAQHRKIVEECDERLGPRPKQELTEDLVNRIFDRYVQAAECIRAEGYEVDPSPSREAFVEAYFVDGPIWGPWMSWHKTVSIAEVERIRKDCPWWVA